MQSILIHPSSMQGTTQVPGDKSISHRALMLCSLAEGTSQVSNFLRANDCLATLKIMRALGISIEEKSPHDLQITGKGLLGLSAPAHELDCQSSGTSMRLLTGLLSAQPFESRLIASAQLQKRPMGRIIKPLREMGADITAYKDNYAPLHIRPVPRLRGIFHVPSISSAQVKSAFAFASLYTGRSIYVENYPTRDHTERMLKAMRKEDKTLSPLCLSIPGDMSSAAFLIAAATLCPKSKLVIKGVGINPTRMGLIDALQSMGAKIALFHERIENDEPFADIVVEHAELKATNIVPEEVPLMIDELPLFALVATQAHGISVVRGARELRVKESNRIEATVSELRKLGAKIEGTQGGFIIEGPTPLVGTEVDSHGDHRLGMMLSIAGLLAKNTTKVHNTGIIADSFPNFASTLLQAGADLHEEV